MRRFFTLILALLIGSWTLKAQESNEAIDELKKFNRFYRYLNALYVEPVEMGPLVEEAIRAMLLELDPHSNYLNPEEMQQEKATMQGAFSGIGIEFRVVEDTIRILQVLPNSAAEEVGLRAGDRILRIDTLHAIGIRQHEVPARIRGEEGSRIELELYRPSLNERFEVVAKRRKVEINTLSAAYRLGDKRGYIKVDRFGYDTYREFCRAMEQMGKVEELILDLQGNGGGLMQQAVAMSSYFLPKGARIVSTEGRAIDPQYMDAPYSGPFRRGKLVILVDDYSASASEIVSGAIQDWDRGVIVGRPTFGKGLVQRQIDLGDGSALRLTIAHYHTPTGRIIQRPYRPGERRAYYEALAQRLQSNETPLNTDSLPRFHTLRTGRTVYGGGGIHPDLLVEVDTAGYTPYLRRLIGQGVISEFTLQMSDRHRDSLLGCWPDYEAFNQAFAQEQFPVEEWLTALDQYAEEQALRDTLPQSEAAQARLLQRLRLHLAISLYGNQIRVRALNDAGANEALNAACCLLDDSTQYEALLAPPRQ